MTAEDLAMSRQVGSPFPWKHNMIPTYGKMCPFDDAKLQCIMHNLNHSLYQCILICCPHSSLFFRNLYFSRLTLLYFRRILRISAAIYTPQFETS